MWGVKKTYFNPFHSCQYTIFLYYYARIIAMQTEGRLLADKLYYLNKMMNGVDLYHQLYGAVSIQWVPLWGVPPLANTSFFIKVVP